MTASGSAHPPPNAAPDPKGGRTRGRAGTSARLTLAVAALAVAGTLATAAIRGTSESTPAAIQLGQVPPAAVPTDRAGLHLVEPRSVDLLTGSVAANTSAGGNAPGSTALESERPSPTRASDSTVPGPNAGVPSTGRGPNGSAPSMPTPAGVTAPTLPVPTTATLPAPVVVPPATPPRATLPGITVPMLPVPTTVPTNVTLPKLPRIPFVDLSGPGSG